MPPPGRPRPDKATYHAAAVALEEEIDRAWMAHPEPGRIGAVHRLNRVEYSNAVRDLFGIDPLSLDVKSLLPGDETADGSFDNFADSLSISTAHLERYLSVARQITRIATGLPPASPGSERYEIPLFVIQDDRQSEDLPLGSRGGIAIRHNFPVDGEYLIKIRLQRQYQDYLKGMGWPQRLDVRLDGKLLKRFTVGGGATGRPAAASYAGDGEPGFAGDDSWEKYMQVGGDAGLELRVPVAGGSHVVGVSFVRELWEPEGLPQPLQRGRVIANDQVYMDYANVGSVQIGGPFARPASAHSIRRVDSDRVRLRRAGPRSASEPARPESCRRWPASRIAGRSRAATCRRCSSSTTAAAATAATSRPASSSRSSACWSIRNSCCESTAIRRQSGVASRQSAVSSRQSAVHRLSDLEVASRLSFFLWSSIPDDRLLSLAERGQLTSPLVLEKETRRMLADPRAIDALVGSFAAQWLNLRRVEEVVVDPERYPNYDLSLLQAFQRETELFVGSTIREDRGVAELLSARYTFVNERLARHYGIPGNLRQPLPPRHADQSQRARGPAGRRRAARDHVVPGPDLSRAARQVAAEQHLRFARAAASARRRHQPRKQAGRPAGIDSRAAGEAPPEPVVQQLPRGHRPARFRARELRRDRRVADRGRGGQARGCQRRDGGGRQGRRAGRPARAAARGPRAVPAHADGEAAGVCARPPARSTRISPRSGRSSAPRPQPTTNGRRSSSGS